MNGCTNLVCNIIGAPVEDGAGRPGCIMGPAAYRTAGLIDVIAELGHTVVDHGDIRPASLLPLPMAHPNPALRNLPEIAAWTRAIADAVWRAGDAGLTICLGGDHSLSAGTLAGRARLCADSGRELFVLWLDAHTDFHTLDSSVSGNLHGVPLAYACGLPGFAGYFPDLRARVDPANVCLMGLRSVDASERRAIARSGAITHDMRAIDEHGLAPLLRAFLERVADAGGVLHVSLDVDFLDPAIAPAVGTTVPGGATVREAHLIMEMLCDSNLVGSLDLAELNPFLDERGRTATLMVDLVASLLGRRVLDRPTREFT